MRSSEHRGQSREGAEPARPVPVREDEERNDGRVVPPPVERPGLRGRGVRRSGAESIEDPIVVDGVTEAPVGSEQRLTDLGSAFSAMQAFPLMYGMPTLEQQAISMPPPQQEQPEPNGPHGQEPDDMMHAPEPDDMMGGQMPPEMMPMPGGLPVRQNPLGMQ